MQQSVAAIIGPTSQSRNLRVIARKSTFVLVLLAAVPLSTQTGATLGRVFDASGAVGLVAPMTVGAQGSGFEGQLPPVSETSFRESTVWERYRWYIIGTIALVALQGLMITALIVQRSRRRETEARNTAIVSAVPDLMLLLSSDGVCVDCHAPAEGAEALKPARFVGRPMREVLAPEVAAVCEDRFAQRLQTAYAHDR